jgi:hypothetical protein
LLFSYPIGLKGRQPHSVPERVIEERDGEDGYDSDGHDMLQGMKQGIDRDHEDDSGDGHMELREQMASIFVDNEHVSDEQYADRTHQPQRRQDNEGKSRPKGARDISTASSAGVAQSETAVSSRPSRRSAAPPAPPEEVSATSEEQIPVLSINDRYAEVLDDEEGGE